MKVRSFLAALAAIVLIIDSVGYAALVKQAPFNAAAYVEKQGLLYGNKTANLMCLRKLCKEEIVKGEIVKGDSEKSIASYFVKVPEFHGVTHGEVIAYLKKNNFDLEARWAALLQQYLYKVQKPEELTQEVMQKTQKALLDKKDLSVEFKAFADAVQALGEEIKNVFKQHPFFSQEELGKLGDNNELGALILKLGKLLSLMVRSTGKEDTKEFANAGGNETVANVEPTAQAVSEAMGVVVASYVGLKSISQRLAVAKTIELIQAILAQPFVPVLIQRMIGEPADGIKVTSAEDVKKIPVPGVMFTTEAEARTPGLTMVQTTFGHNEGVVNSLVPVDTWYIGPNNIFYPIIRNKTVRLVPQTAAELAANPEKRLKYATNVWGEGKNKHSFGQNPTLSEASERALKKLSNKIEAFYGDPMDVEFVFMPVENTIYLVQARPIVFGKAKEPTYVSDEFIAKVSSDNKIECTKIGIGKAQVAIIDGVENKILIGAELRDVLALQYLTLPTKEREKVKCIIVKEDAAATSHEATTFRAEQKPVLQCKDQDIDQFRGRKLTIDVQRGLVLLDQAAAASDIKPDWIEFPAPKQLSVMQLLERPIQAHLIYSTEDEGERAKILRATRLDMFVNIVDVKSSPRMKEALDAALSANFMAIKQNKDILTTVESADEDLEDQGQPLKYNLLAVLYKLWKEICPEKEEDKTFEIFITRFPSFARNLLRPKSKFESHAIAQHIFDQAYLCAYDILLNTVDLKGQNDLRILYPIHFLQTLFEQKGNEQVIASHSVKTLRGGVGLDRSAVKSKAASAIINAAKQAEAQIKQSGDKGSQPRKDAALKAVAVRTAAVRSIEVLKMSVVALTTDVKDQWNALVANVFEETIKQAPDVQLAFANQFFDMILTLGQLDLYPIWLNVIFPSIVKQNPKDGATDYVAVRAKLLADYLQVEPTLKNLHEISNNLKAFDIKRFEAPAQFKTAWADFMQLYGNFTGPLITDIFKGGPQPLNLAQIAALQVMQAFVDKFDLAIKTMKGSTQFDVDTKVANFKEMVIKDWELFEAWVKLLPRGTFKTSESSALSESGEGARGSNLNVSKYIAHYNLLKATPFRGEEQLYSSAGFNVSLITIGNTVQERDQRPIRIEDYFTLSHQNLLIIIAAFLNKIIDINEMVLPPVLNGLRDFLTKEIIFFHSSLMGARIPTSTRPLLINVTLDMNEISFFYNLPMRHHSASIVLRYNLRNKKTYADIHVLQVVPRYYNCSRIDYYARFYPKLVKGISWVESNYNAMEARLLWEITEQIKISDFSESIIFILQNAYGMTVSAPLIVDFFEIAQKPPLEDQIRAVSFIVSDKDIFNKIENSKLILFIQNVLTNVQSQQADLLARYTPEVCLMLERILRMEKGLQPMVSQLVPPFFVKLLSMPQCINYPGDNICLIRSYSPRLFDESTRKLLIDLLVQGIAVKPLPELFVIRQVLSDLEREFEGSKALINEKNKQVIAQIKLSCEKDLEKNYSYLQKYASFVTEEEDVLWFLRQYELLVQKNIHPPLLNSNSSIVYGQTDQSKSLCSTIIGQMLDKGWFNNVVNLLNVFFLPLEDMKIKSLDLWKRIKEYVEKHNAFDENLGPDVFIKFLADVSVGNMSFEEEAGYCDVLKAYGVFVRNQIKLMVDSDTYVDWRNIFDGYQKILKNCLNQKLNEQESSDEGKQHQFNEKCSLVAKELTNSYINLLQEVAQHLKAAKKIIICEDISKFMHSVLEFFNDYSLQYKDKSEDAKEVAFSFINVMNQFFSLMFLDGSDADLRFISDSLIVLIDQGATVRRNVLKENEDFDITVFESTIKSSIELFESKIRTLISLGTRNDEVLDVVEKFMMQEKRSSNASIIYQNLIKKIIDPDFEVWLQKYISSANSKQLVGIQTMCDTLSFGYGEYLASYSFKTLKPLLNAAYAKPAEVKAAAAQ